MFEPQPLRPMATKGCRYVTRQPLPEHGLEAGAPFPYAELGITELHAYNLHRAGVLAVAPLTPSIPDPVPANVEVTAQAPAASATAHPTQKRRDRR